MDHENEQEKPVAPSASRDEQAETPAEPQEGPPQAQAAEDAEPEALPGRELTEEDMAQAAVNLDRCQRCTHLDEKPTEEGHLRCTAHKMLMRPERNEMPDDCVLFEPKK